MSKDCYLYKQRDISNELRIKNLGLLVQRPEARSSATIEDLQNAILSDDGTPELAPADGNAVYETDIVTKVWLV